MKIYTKYLSYILRHKFYVLVECFKRGQYIRGIMHDMSKFRPDEFIPYARYFNGNYCSEKNIPMFLPMSYKGILTKESVEIDFNIAWLKHIHRNKHHWQYWILREDDGKIIKIEMPYKYLQEMLSDWTGAGKAITGKDNTKEWYKENKSRMMMNEYTREEVEMDLGFTVIDLCAKEFDTTQ